MRYWWGFALAAAVLLMPFHNGGCNYSREEDDCDVRMDPPVLEGEPGQTIEVTLTGSVGAVPEKAELRRIDARTYAIRLPLEEGTYAISVRGSGESCVQQIVPLYVRRKTPSPTDGGVSDSDAGGACGGRADDLLAAGSDTTVARACGCTYAWGINNRAQLGLGETGTKEKPVAAPLFATASSVSTDSETTCLAVGSATSCFGVLFNPGPTPAPQRSTTPVPVPLPAAAKKVTTAATHQCAITIDGALYCWGSDANGAVGDGYQSDPPFERSPYLVLTGATDVATAGHHSCAVTSDKGVKCWGELSAGNVLGTAHGTDPALAHTPRPVLTNVAGTGTPITGAIAVTTGRFHTCALKDNARVECWGSDEHGQLGDGASTMNAFNVVPVSGLTDAVQIGAGAEFTCALRGNKTVVCWGNNRDGQLGIGSAPTPVVELTEVDRIAVGWTHACAQKRNGAVYCWGTNRFTTIGTGSPLPKITAPVLVLPPCR